MVASGKMLARQLLVRATTGRVIARNRKGKQSQEIRRILVIRPDHLGDLLFATPALAILREAFPDAHLTGAVGPWGRAMWEGNPNLDALTTIPFPGIAGSIEGGPLAPYKLLRNTAKRLSVEQYDLGIALRFDHWWGAALMWASGIPRRWGYDTPGMGAWLTDKVPYVKSRHEVEQDLMLVEAVWRGVGVRRAVPLQVDRNRGEPRLITPTPIAPPDADRMLGEWLSSSRRVVIHPGTGAANKLWTINGWSEVIQNLRTQGWAVALTGSPNERTLADAIVSAHNANVGAGHAPPAQDQPPLLNLAGQTSSLGELTWVLNEAHVVLGVDSGPLHIATALDKPTLHLYGPTDEAIWGPWGNLTRHRPFRAKDTDPTMSLDIGSQELEGGPEMRAITPEMVLVQVEELMRET